MKKILEHKNYPTIMYLLIVSISIILSFNFMGIIIDANIDNQIFNNQNTYEHVKGKITGYVTSNSNNENSDEELTDFNPTEKNQSNNESGELYTEKSYGIFYIIIITIIALIIFITVSMLLPRLKHMT